MFQRSNQFGKYGNYGYIGQADWFYGGKPAAEFNPCKPGQIKEEWGGGIRCIDPAMMPKAPAPTTAPAQTPVDGSQPATTTLPPETTQAPIIDPSLLDDEGYDLEELLPFIIGGGVVIVLVWVLILKL